MGWWTRLIASSDGREEERWLRQEVARLESAPASPHFLTALGRLHEWLDEPDAAIEVYRRGLAMNREASGPLWITLQLENGEWYVRDLGAPNGTTLNGVELVGTAKLESFFELQLAERVVRVKILGE